VQQAQPDENCSLAAQCLVAISFETSEYTAKLDAVGPRRPLEAMRILGLTGKTRFCQASIFGMFSVAQ